MAGSERTRSRFARRRGSGVRLPPSWVRPRPERAEALGYDSLWTIERLLWPVKPQTPYPVTADGSLPEGYKYSLDPLDTLGPDHLGGVPRAGDAGQHDREQLGAVRLRGGLEQHVDARPMAIERPPSAGPS